MTCALCLDPSLNAWPLACAAVIASGPHAGARFERDARLCLGCVLRTVDAPTEPGPAPAPPALPTRRGRAARGFEGHAR